jgi:two-component system, OmpR family, phosphate regulon sensor histidine kinase PhoR
MRSRTFLRVFVGYVAVSLLAVLIFAFYTLRLAGTMSFDALTRGLEGAALTARVAVMPLLSQGRSAQLDALVVAMGKEGSVRFTVIDLQGVVLADSQEKAATMENHSLRPEVSKALLGTTGISLRLSSTVGRRMVYVAVPVLSSAGVVQGVVRTATYPEQLQQAALRNSGGLALFSTILFVACLLAALLFSRTISAPLGDLAGVVERFSAGDFGARLHLRRRDEIRSLAESFNAMGERVQSLFLERSRRAQELDGIFHSVQQGILVLDSDGRIVRSNKGFEDLAGAARTEGKTLWETVRAPLLTELVQRARTTGLRQSEEVTLGEKTVLCTVERMAGRDELIVVLHDTSELRRLETVKRDFVVNASHELRTPLTSIIGSLEMLEGELPGDAARWVDAIRRNAERMSAIVQDLMLLSRLEAKGPEPSARPIDLKQIAQEVTGMFANRAQAQGISLQLSVPETLPPLRADGFLLEQMLVNLVDNALKYTEKGEVRVSCAVEGTDRLSIEVADTGIGIPEESLPRIFERFYVVDKSRSRKLGGTGLGLAIVKHIVQSHAGSIDVKSTLGAGTRVTVRLPIGKES